MAVSRWMIFEEFMKKRNDGGPGKGKNVDGESNMLTLGLNIGEDGVKDTGDLEGLLTTAEEATEFVDTGIDFLAPAFGNVHGSYGGIENIKLDYDRFVHLPFLRLKSFLPPFHSLDHFPPTNPYSRLDSIRTATSSHVQLVLHGTNTFPEDTMRNCIKGGMTRCNVNELVLHKYSAYVKENTGKVPLTELMEKGTDLIQELVEHWMDVMGSSGKA